MDFKRKLDEALQLLDEQAGRFSSVTRDLDAIGVDYVTVGGAAVTQYGWPRLTADVDVLMDVDAYDRLDDPNFEKRPLGDGNFGKLTHKPTNMKIDVLLGGRGPFPHLEKIERGNDPHLISVEGLIFLKTLRGDPSDYGDVYRIVKSGTKIDWQKVKNLVSAKAWGRLEADVLGAQSSKI